MRISEFIEQSNQQTSPEAVLSLMQRAAGEIGFDRYAYCALTGHDRYLPGNKPAPAIALNFPSCWTDYYFAHRYQTVDPVIVNAPLIDGPFLWETMGKRYRLTGRQKLVMHQAAEAKLRDGVGVPLHGPFGSVCLLTFASGDGNPDAKALLPRLNLLSAQFHLAYGEVGRADSTPTRIPSLTARERECLQWISTGRSRPEVADVLHLSESTVGYHLHNVNTKLEATNTILAVVKALRYRLISLWDDENYRIR